MNLQETDYDQFMANETRITPSSFRDKVSGWVGGWVGGWRRECIHFLFFLPSPPFLLPSHPPTHPPTHLGPAQTRPGARLPPRPRRGAPGHLYGLHHL